MSLIFKSRELKIAEIQIQDNKKKLDHINEIEGRFYRWVLSEQQEIDFAWLCKTLKEELKQE